MLTQIDALARAPICRYIRRNANYVCVKCALLLGDSKEMKSLKTSISHKNKYSMI